MNDFTLTNKFLGYASSPELTNMNVEYLASGSKNMLIDWANRVVTRAGMALYGAAAGVNTGPVRSSYEWDTSVTKQTSLRSHYDFDLGGVLDFSYLSNYYTLKSGLSGVDIEFAEWWDATERISRLLFVLGDKKIYDWGGGVATVQSNTANTITLQGVMTAKATIAFVAGTAGTVAATITDSASGFLTAGFAVGNIISVTGSAANSRNFQIGSVTAGTITLIMANILTSEAAGPAISISNGIPSWNAAGAGFLKADANRKVLINGVEYAYSGGEDTDTITGLAGLPIFAVGTLVTQSVISHANPGAIDAFFNNDFIGIEDNQVWLGSKISRNVFIAQNTDFTNFTVPAIRAPGDPGIARLDNYTTKIITLDNTELSASNSNLSAAIVCGGNSDFVRLEFRMTADNTKEIIKGRKMKSSALSGIIGRGAICNTHEGTAYISSEPVIDFLERVESRDHKPLSDLIRPDLQSYDLTDVHMAYTSRAITIAIPRMGIVLIYDLLRNLWHPPQYFSVPISRIGVLRDGSIIGHSAISAETYTLFTGTNDLGNAISFVANFPYMNRGRSSEFKFVRYYTDGYITANGELALGILYGFAGKTGIGSKTILGTEPKTVQQAGGVGLGQNPLGFNPFGGAPLAAQVNLLRFALVHKFPLFRATETQTSYSMSTLDGQFAIVAHGPAFTDEYEGTLLAGITID